MKKAAIPDSRECVKGGAGKSPALLALWAAQVGMRFRLADFEKATEVGDHWDAFGTGFCYTAIRSSERFV
jgi:hypothetical protein